MSSYGVARLHVPRLLNIIHVYPTPSNVLFPRLDSKMLANARARLPDLSLSDSFSMSDHRFDWLFGIFAELQNYKRTAQFAGAQSFRHHQQSAAPLRTRPS
mgnify:CR=1 FL=1